MNYHLTIARWLRNFLEITKERIFDTANASDEEEPVRTDAGSDYIVASGESDTPTH